MDEKYARRKLLHVHWERDPESDIEKVNSFPSFACLWSYLVSLFVVNTQCQIDLDTCHRQIREPF
jgi:hypothetical protein